MGEPITQFCSKCKTRKPISGFNINRGLCADCKGTSQPTTSSKKGKTRNVKASKLPSAQPAKKKFAKSRPKSWKCPNCLQRIQVLKWALVQHKNARGQVCRGSGYEPPQPSRDALDHRVSGSFEGGRR